MRTILRNFLVTLRRFKLASALNILGLSVAFAAFTVILIQVRYDLGFDRFHSRTGQIFRVEISRDSVVYQPLIPRPMADLLMNASMDIEQGSIVGGAGCPGPYLTIDRSVEKAGFKEKVVGVYPGFIEIFDFDLVEGEKENFGKADQVFIPQSMAQRFWGAGAALGRSIDFSNDTVRTLYVGGVYRDFPANTWLGNFIYVTRQPDIYTPFETWENDNQQLYVLLSPAAKKESVEQSMWHVFAKRATDFPAGLKEIESIRLTAVEDIYFDSTVLRDSHPKGDWATTQMMLSIAVLIIFVAAINFINFSTALTPLRIRSINTQKILGSSDPALRRALMGEGIGISLLAFVLALFWIYLLHYFGGWTSYFVADIAVERNLPVVVIASLAAVGVGLLSGLYPAWYSTSFSPAMVLKGTVGVSSKGKRLRLALTGFQFVVAIGLITAALFMQLQNDFMRQKDTGMITDQIAVVELNENLATQQRDLLVSRLLENKGIEQVGFAGLQIGGSDAVTQFGRTTADGDMIYFDVIGVTWEIPKMLGIEVVDGRPFRPEDEQTGHAVYLFNQMAGRMLKIAPGYIVDPLNERGDVVVGIMKDFNYRSLRNEIEPMALLVNDRFTEVGMLWMYIKITGDAFAGVEQIKKTVASIDPSYPADVRFYDGVFDQLYQSERRTAGLVTLFSLLAVAISLVGVFGLVVFETQYRKKEIGVRRVMGATIGEILVMFNRRFVWTILFCFILAGPVAWYGVTRWQGAFVYKTPLHWWIFLVAFVIVLGVTLATVSIQSWRAASANPVKSLRSE